MSYARQLLDTYPGTLNADAGVLAATLDALNDCAQACAADADADLAEQDLAEMVRCIRLCLDCTDVCTATLGVVSRQTYHDPTVTRPLLEACVATCKSCGDECARHASGEHARSRCGPSAAVGCGFTDVVRPAHLTQIGDSVTSASQPVPQTGGLFRG